MTLAGEGDPFVIGAAGLAVIAFVLALRLRSWPLWLVAFAMLVMAITAGWLFRDAGRGA